MVSPLARIASTSELACQKNRYGEMVVPRIATMMPMKPDVNSMCGMTVDSIVCNSGGCDTITVAT